MTDQNVAAPHPGAHPPGRSAVQRFEATGQEVNIGVHPHHKPPRDMTIEAWICAESHRQWHGIVSRIFDTGSTESGYGLLLDGSGGIYFGIRTTSNQNFYFSSGPNTIELKRWHHVAAVYDGSQIVIYIDGRAKATAALSGDIDYDPENNLTIGTYHDNDEQYRFPGKVAEVRLWGVARSAAQIEADMARRLGGDEAGLVGYWPLDEGSGAVAHDRTRHASHGVINAPVWEVADVPFAAAPASAPAPSSKPNILLIIADDCGVDLLRINESGEVVAQLEGPDGRVIGGQRLKNIERLVKGGVRFTQAWAHPVCAPSRASVFTGLHPWRHGVGFPSEDCILPELRPHSDVPIRSMAEVLAPAGYRSAMFGKWDLGGPEEGHKRTAMDWGWDHFEGLIGGGLRPQKALKYWFPETDEVGPDVIRLETLDSTALTEDAPPHALSERKQVRDRVAEYLQEHCPDYLAAQRDIRYYVCKKDIEDRAAGIRRYSRPPTERTHLYATKDHFISARDWIKQNYGRPWFVAMTSIAPHDPYHVPPQESFTLRFRDPAKPTTQELLVAMVQSLDYYIGEILNSKEVEVRDQLKNTVILFVSDNGTQDDDPDSRSASGKGEALDDDQKDKGTHYVGGCHVPLVVVDGGALFAGKPCYMDIAQNSVVRAPVHIVDLFATCAEIAGATAPADIDAVSLLPAVRNAAAARRRFNFSQQFAPFGGRKIAIHASVSDGKYKLSCVRTKVVDAAVADEYEYMFSVLEDHPTIPGAQREDVIEAFYENNLYLEAAKRLATELEHHHLTPGHAPKQVAPLKFPALKIPEQAAYRYVRLVALSEVNGGPWTSVADFQVLADGVPLDRAKWQIMVDAEEAGYEGQKAVDPTRVSMWHTPWTRSTPRHPHWISVDLQAPRKVSGFIYQPRQDMPNGRIADYEFQVSNDGENWSTVCHGRFPNTAQDQIVSVLAPNRNPGQSPGCRHVRLVAKSEVAGNPWTAIEDFALFADGKPIDRSDWSVAVDSQEHRAENGNCRNAIDGQAGTSWVTEWSRLAPRHPHWLSVDLQSQHHISGFRYQPRASQNGRIAEYELQVSNDGQNWTTVTNGTFPNNAEAQVVNFILPRLS